MSALDRRLAALEAAQQQRATEQRAQAQESPLPPHLRQLLAEMERRDVSTLPPHLRALLNDSEA